MEPINFEKPTFSHLFYNPTMIHHFAKEFFKTGYKVIAEYERHVTKHLDGIPDWNIYQKTVVSATNISFALELGLKGLRLLVLGKIKKGHLLIDLFEYLPYEIQEMIAQVPKVEKYAIYRNICFGDNPVLDHHIDYIDGTLEEVKANLIEQKNSYPDFRYFFEQGIKSKLLYFNFPAMLNITHNTLKVLNKLNLKHIDSL